MKFYVDTNIYLNLWKKEGDASKGVPYWKLAKDFLDKAEKEGLTIAFSGLIIKELQYKLTNEQFEEKKKLLESTYQKIEVIQEDYANARKCQKPPFIEGWHAANANVIQWFLSTVGIPR